MFVASLAAHSKDLLTRLELVQTLFRAMESRNIPFLSGVEVTG